MHLKTSRSRCRLVAHLTTVVLPLAVAGCVSSGDMIVATQSSLQNQATVAPAQAEAQNPAAAGGFSVPGDGVPLALETTGDLPPSLNYLPTARPGDAAGAIALAPVPVAPSAQPTIPVEAQAAPGQQPQPASVTEPVQSVAAVAPFPAVPPAPDAAQPVEPAAVPAPSDRPAVAEQPAGAVQPTQFVENSPAPPAASVPEPKRERFLSSLFGSQPSRPPVAMASFSPPPSSPRALVEAAAPVAGSATAAPPAAQAGQDLPGVRTTALFEVRRSTGSVDDDGDVDLYEDDAPQVQLASAAGLARLAPNGLMKQTDHVEVTCLKPALVRVLASIESHYGQKPVVTSGYRAPPHNSRARGARNSLHMFCAAADVQVPGVSKWELAQFARTMPGRRGVGTYCHTDSVHIDIGPERDWNWRCRRRR